MRSQALVVAAFLLLVLASPPVRGRVARAATFHFESEPSGEISVVAQQVPITEALSAIADEAGFEVSIYKAMTRPLVNLTLDTAPVEHVVRELLRGRNYALVYDSDTHALRRVILLAPSSAGPSRAPPRKPVRRPARRQQTRAPVVIRN